MLWSQRRNRYRGSSRQKAATLFLDKSSTGPTVFYEVWNCSFSIAGTTEWNSLPDHRIGGASIAVVLSVACQSSSSTISLLFQFLSFCFLYAISGHWLDRSALIYN